MFGLNSTFTADVADRSSTYGYTDYSGIYATYSPKGILPLPQAVISGDPHNLTDKCWVLDDILRIKYVIANPQRNVECAHLPLL
jgi:hypothetical protein